MCKPEQGYYQQNVVKPKQSSGYQCSACGLNMQMFIENGEYVAICPQCGERLHTGIGED